MCCWLMQQAKRNARLRPGSRAWILPLILNGAVTGPPLMPPANDMVVLQRSYPRCTHHLEEGVIGSVLVIEQPLCSLLLLLRSLSHFLPLHLCNNTFRHASCLSLLSSLPSFSPQTQYKPQRTHLLLPLNTSNDRRHGVNRVFSSHAGSQRCRSRIHVSCCMALMTGPPLT